MKRSFQLFADAGVPHPCCVPSRQRAAQLADSRAASAARIRAAGGPVTDMARLDGGPFLMGTDSDEGFAQDGEGPIRQVTLDPFYIDIDPVTNARFAEFAGATGYLTEAERFGWSFVFQGHIPPDFPGTGVDRNASGIRWWYKVAGADWRHPEGPDSGLIGRDNIPVVHVSWNDA